MVASHAIVIKVVRRDSNAMLQVNAHVMTMLKEDGATDARRTNTIAIKAVWIVPIVIIWFAMLPTIIVGSWPI